MAHNTYKGRSIDMAAMLLMNEHAVALGNANLNARGDKLGRAGKVVRTAEEIAEDTYNQLHATPVVTDEAPAVHEPQMEEFNPALLSGYDEEAAPKAPLVEETETKVKPKRGRRKAPKADE